MPRKGIKPPIIGAYPALRGEIWNFISNPKQKAAALRFATGLGKLEKLVFTKRHGKIAFQRKPCSTNDTLESGIMALADIALQPEIMMAIATGTPHGKNVITPTWFARLYATEPDFVLSVLSFIRRRWGSTRATKATRLFHFMANAGNFYIKPLPHQKLRPISICTDKEIASAFENSPDGETVTIDDVVQARRKVTRAVYRSLSIARRHRLLVQPKNYLHGPVIETIPLRRGYSQWPIDPQSTQTKRAR